MRTRHRVPTLFTLSMMDVFCCALGCVILLWLWNDRLAKQKAKAAGDTKSQLDQTQATLADARKSIDTMKAELAAARRRLDSQDAALADARQSIDSLNGDLKSTRDSVAALTTERDRLQDQLTDAKTRAAALTTDRDRLRGDLTATRKTLDDKAKDLKDLQAKTDASADLLAKKIKDYDKYVADVEDYLSKKKKDEDRLTASAAKAQKQVLDLETLVRQKEERIAVAMRKSDELTKQLHETEGTLKQLRTQADDATGLRSKIDAQGEKLSAAEARMREMERDLTKRKTVMQDVQGKVEELRGENVTLAESNKKLTDQITRIRLAADNRFAGIQLTGRRIVLLVDMSGSMKLSEERVPAPDKWPGVADTAWRISKSLPDLEKFQLIMFAEQVTYPLGSDGQWLDFDAATSPDRIRRAIADTVPRGGTNMYSPMEAAFSLRATGLDTIYLLSDGLPNEGPGLSAAEQARNLNEQQMGEILGKHIRGTLKQKWNRVEAGKPQVRINSIGFFYESPDVGAFLWALSRENDGSFVGMR